MAAVQINTGTAVTIQTTLVGGTETQVTRLDIGSGTAASQFTGTFLGGTVNVINAGTLDTISQLPPNYFWTTASTGTTTLGTIKAAVSGSAIFVKDIIVSVGTLASNVVIGMGGTSTPLIGTLSFAANGGMVSNFTVPGSVTLGSALVYQQSVGVALTVTVGGFVR